MFSKFHLLFPANWEETLFKHYKPDPGKIIAKIKEICITNAQSLTFDKKNFYGQIVYTHNCDVDGGAHRLLFELVKRDGNNLLVLRNIAFNHNYHVGMQWKPLDEQTIAALPETKAVKLVIPDEAEAATFHPENWIKLSEPQRAILEDKKLPLMVIGPPGSGKTMIAMTLIQQAALNYQGKELLTILFITTAENLKNVFENEWRRWAKDNIPQAPVRVVCRTFNEFMTWCIDELEQKDVAPADSCLTFITKHPIGLDSMLIFREFLLASYVLNQDIKNNRAFKDSEYKKLGERASNVLPEKKEQIFNLYKRYIASLQDEQSVKFSSLREDDYEDGYKFDLAFVDECQEAGTQQLLNVLSVVKGKQLVYSGDSRQSIQQAVSPTNLLPKLLYTLGINLTIEQLTKTYRLRPSVAAFYKQLVLLEDRLYEGRRDKTAYSSIVTEGSAKDDESLSWIETYNDSYCQLGQNAKNAAIILDEQDRQMARECLGGSANIFLSDQVHGLEFQNVMVVISRHTLEAFTEISQKMEEKNIASTTELQEYTHLSAQKDSAAHASSILPLSKLMLAISRSQGNVWIYCAQYDAHYRRLHYFTDWLKAKCSGHAEVTSQKSSREEWLSAIHTFILHQNVSQAQENLMMHLELNQANAEQYLAFISQNTNTSIEQGMAFIDTLRQQPAAVRHPQIVPPASVSAERIPSLMPENTRRKDEEEKEQASIKATASPKAVVKAKASKEKKQTTSGNIPHCLEKFTAETVGDNLNDIMTTILGAPKAGYWLCEHQFSDGKTLFEVAFGSALMSLRLLMILKKNGALRESFFHAITPYFEKPVKSNGQKTQATHFQLLIGQWREFGLDAFTHRIKDGIDKTSLNKEIVFDSLPQGLSVLYCLLLKPETLQLINIHFSKITKETWTRVITTEGKEQGSSPFYCLCRAVYGMAFFVQQWAYFRDKISAAQWHQPVTGKGQDTGKSPFYWLCAYSKGSQLLIEHWEFFKNKINQAQLHQPVTAEGEDQSMSPFIWLCANEGCKLLLLYWEFFKNKISQAQLHQPVTGEGEDKGKSPFYYLCANPEGCQLLLKHWDFFEDNINQAELHQPVTGKGEDQGKSPFSRLCATSEGCQLLLDHWDFFKDNISQAQLHQPVTAVGKDKGKTPFYYLCANPKGRQLLLAHWDFFKERINAEQLHQPVTAVGKDKGKTPFYYLCANQEGCKLLINHWDFFKDNISQAQLHQPVTAEGENKGTSPFYWLCGNPESCKLLLNHWNFFKDNISQAQLHQPVTGKGEDQGKSPFYWLCNNLEGNQLLIEHWEFFKDNISQAQLHQPVTAERENKGKSPFYWLCVTPEGRQVLLDQWDFFKDKISPEQLHQLVTGEGEDKGISPFYWLCATPEGCQLLLDQWDFFKNKINQAQLHQPVTGGGENQGKSPFYWLCATPEGCQLLLAHWDFFEDKISPKQLQKPITSEGPFKGESLFGCLCTSIIGRTLIVSQWDFFKDKMTLNEFNLTIMDEPNTTLKQYLLMQGITLLPTQHSSNQGFFYQEESTAKKKPEEDAHSFGTKQGKS